MQADAKLHATRFPDNPDFFKGVLRAMRMSRLAHMTELRVRFCANPQGGAPNYEVSNEAGDHAHCYASTHSSFPETLLDQTEPEFDSKLLGRRIYKMEDIQDMLRERLERQGNIRRRPASEKTELRKKLEALLA